MPHSAPRPQVELKPFCHEGCWLKPMKVTTGNMRDAAAAIIYLPNGAYVMQLRDDRPDIWYPDHWGCFGGAVDGDETPEQALLRELHEELGFRPRTFRLFSSHATTIEPIGLTTVRHYFEVAVDEEEFQAMVVREGQGCGLLTSDDICGPSPRYRLAAYDAFAMLLHVNLLAQGVIARQQP